MAEEQAKALPKPEQKLFAIEEDDASGAPPSLKRAASSSKKPIFRRMGSGPHAPATSDDSGSSAKRSLALQVRANATTVGRV